MSDAPPPPPPQDAPQDVPSPPLPPAVPPVPVGPSFDADPIVYSGAGPLAYSLPTTHVRPVRPFLVTAVGALSIFMSFLTAAGGVATAAAAFLFYAGAQAMSRDMAASAASVNRPGVTAPAAPVKRPPEVGPNGLASPHRGAILEALYAVRPLRPPRVEQLDAILAGHGRTILLTPAERQAGANISPDRVRNLVLDHGELFSSSRAPAPEFFKLPTGRLELYDDRAVFHPTDGTPAIRNAFGRTPARRALTEGEVAEIVNHARYLSREKLSDAQASALAAVLSAPDQKLVAPAPADGAAPAPSEPASVTPGAGGAVSIRFGNGRLDLGPQGQVLGGPPPPAPPPRPSTAAFVTVILASLGGAALAVPLFIAAVLLLRGLPAGRRLHLTWAWLKLPLAAAAAVTFWWMASQFYEELADFSVQSATVRLFNMRRPWMAQPWQPVAAGLLAVAYPLLVLLVMRARSVREYFHPTD